MKLCRIETPEGLRPAAVDGGGVLRDLSGHLSDLGAAALAPAELDRLRALDLSTLPPLGTGTPAPILADIGRIFCIGLNYSDHAAEAGMPVPEQPILFMKVCPPSGAHAPIVLPKGSEKTDWEVELGVVIGREAAHVSEAEALDHVAGYCIVHDVSERSFQFDHGGQWVKGKSCDSFAPVGPWLVTADEVPDPQDLEMFLDVNGERMQTGQTRNMIFGVAALVAHLSRYITLRPGDLIATGTPAGVGVGMTPPRFLKAGDMVRLGIGGLGEQEQKVVAWPG